MKKIYFILSLLLCSVSPFCFAQTSPITFRLVDKNTKPIIGATLRLIDVRDSSKVLYQLSDTSGVAKFKAILAQNYLIKVSAIGYKSIQKGIRPSTQQNSFRLLMEEDNQLLGEVQISVKRPLLRQEDDKTIVDPEPLAASSTSVMEIMEKVPGLFVDQEGNVYLNSSTPASIYINGREQKLSAADVASILKSLPPNSIDKIEILRTPSSKYDASGSGGLVNIVLKKGVKIGLTGSANSGMNQGRYGNQFVGFNLNNSSGSRTSYLNMNLSKRNTYDQVSTTRAFSADSALTQKSFTTFPSNVIFIGYGLGFEPTKKWELNFDGRLNLNNTRSDATNINQIGRVKDGLLWVESNNLANNKTTSGVFSQDVTAKFKVDTLGSEWITMLSYNFSKNNVGQDFSSNFIKPFTKTFLGDGQIDNTRHFLNAQTDLTLKLKYGITFETGLKAGIQRFDNQTQYFNVSQSGNRLKDSFRTRSFVYKEEIYAGYVQASKTFSGFVLKAGLRLENTNMLGRQTLPSDTSFKINRTDLFPYLYLSRKIAKVAGYELRSFFVYRRSITRPVYEYLNPFPKYIDQYLYETGNPTLRPQFTQNLEVNISVMEMPIFAFGKNYTQDIFTNVVYQDKTNPSLAFRTYDNLGKNEETYFRLLVGLPPGGRYFGVFGSQYNHNQYNGQYEGKPLTFSRGSWSLFTFHSFKIDKRSTFNLNGFWRLKGQLQFYELSNFGNLNLSVNRNFLERKLTITASVSDLFFTNRNEFVLSQGSINAIGQRQSDTQRFGLNIRYNFGLRKKDNQPNMMNFDNLEKGSN